MRSQAGFACHPCMGATMGLVAYLAVALPLAKEPGAPPGLAVWALIALGVVLNVVAGWVTWEGYLFYLLGGLGAPALVHWILRELAGVDVPAATGAWQWFFLYAFTLLPVAIVAGVEARRYLRSRPAG